MYKRFKWIPALILNVVTCGIYSMFMWFKLAKEQNDMAEKVGEKKIKGFIVAFLLGCITFGIYPMVWMFLYAKQQAAVAEAKGVELTPVKIPVVLWLLTFVPVYSFYVICENHNRLADDFEA